MHRKPTIMLLLAAALLVFVGCSSDTTTTTTAGETTTSVAPETTTSSVSDLSGQTIEVAAVWSGAEQANFQQIIDAFQEQSGVQVTFTSTGDQIATILGTRMQGGSPPDVAILPQPGLMYSLADQGALQPLTDVISMEMDTNYAPVWKDLGTYDGTLYGLVFKAANKSTFWYNMSVFEDAGVTPPTTWEELLAAADTIQRFGVAPFSVAGADGWTLTDWFENVYLRRPRKIRSANDPRDPLDGSERDHRPRRAGRDLGQRSHAQWWSHRCPPDGLPNLRGGRVRQPAQSRPGV